MNVSALSVSRTRPAGDLADPVIGAHVADQARHRPLDLERAVRLADPPAVLAVAAIGQPRPRTGVPEIARGGVRQVAVVVVVNPGPARVRQGPVAGDVVGVVRHRRPGVAVGRDVAVAIEVVEQHELLGQLVMVGRDVAAEHHQRRVAVAARHVAEDLVVGPILLDDVEHVLDRRRLADLGRNGGFLGVGGVGRAACRNRGSSCRPSRCNAASVLSSGTGTIDSEPESVVPM